MKTLQLVAQVVVVWCAFARAARAGSVFDERLYASALDERLCERQLALLASHSLKHQFIDASARIPSNVLTAPDLGDYHTCLGINVVVGDLVIQGKYCALSAPAGQKLLQWPQLQGNTSFVSLPENYTQDYQHTSRKGVFENSSLVLPEREVTLAVCVPRVCTAERALEFVQQRLQFLNFTYKESYCRLPDDKPFATADLVALIIFSMIALITAASSAYDVIYVFILKNDPSEINGLFRCCSVYTNTKQLLTFKSTQDALECVDGIRAISMLWIVVFHTYTTQPADDYQNRADMIDWTEQWESLWIHAGVLAVDTFFLLSGILTVYATLKKTTQAHFLKNLHLFYFNRLVRLFPILAAMVLMQASVFHHISDGPVWYVANNVKNCRNWWWKALIHIQNYVRGSEMCLSATWYLAADMQLHLVSPLVLVGLMWGKTWPLGSALLLTLLGSSTFIFIKKLFMLGFATHHQLPEEIVLYYNLYYFNTLTRASPFIVGMIYGYILHLWRGKDLRFTKRVSGALWLASLSMMTVCLLSFSPLMPLGRDYWLLRALVNAYLRTVWAAALGFVLLACVKGYGGPINWFLSLHVWKLPARLSYAMYLVHASLIELAFSSWTHAHYFNSAETFYRFAANVTLTGAVAFVLCVVVDAPCAILHKLFLDRVSRNPKSEKCIK